VTDFGLAKQERPELTATGAILGTPSYMAPEQAVGDNRAVGPAADVYALGAILYELLTGRPPFQAATVLETLEQVKGQDPVPPSQLRSRLPRDLSTICLKCLRKEPAQRYPSALGLAEDLRRFLEAKPIQARPAGLAERAWRWGRRKPGWAAMLGTVAALLLVIAVGTWVGIWWLGKALAVSEANRRGSDQNLERALRAERATEEKLFDAQLAQARGNSLSRRPGQRFESLAVLAEATERARRLELPPERFLDLRNAVIAVLALPDLHAVQTRASFPEGSSTVDFDEELAVYARTDDLGNCEVRRLADDHLLHHLPGPPPGTSIGLGSAPYLSRDGRFLAVRNDTQLQVWRLTGTEPIRLFGVENAVFLDFHPSSPQAAVGHTDGAISV